MFRQRADSLRGEGTHTENTVTVFWAQCWHVALPVVVGVCSPGSASGFGTTHLEKGGSCSSCASSSSLLDVFLANTAARYLHLCTFSQQLHGACSSQGFARLLSIEILTTSRDFSSGTFPCKNQFGGVLLLLLLCRVVFLVFLFFFFY